MFKACHIVVFILAMVIGQTSMASSCPDGQKLLEMHSIIAPEKSSPRYEEEKDTTLAKFKNDLEKLYPDAQIDCGIKYDKYLFCVACTEETE